MDLDRDSIEKNDFPIGRRGYDPGAVDAHLREVAREVQRLREAARSPAEDASLAAAASGRVQAILEAAETTAANLQREVQAEALRLRREAEGGAEQAREEAIARAEAHVQAVAKATSLMLQRLAAMESESSKLVEGLRAGVERVSADLAALEAGLGELYDAAGGSGAARWCRQASRMRPATTRRRPRRRRRPLRRLRLERPRPRPDGAPIAGTRARPATPRPARARAASPKSGARASAANGGAAADIDGARLIALNMALSGQSREEAERYLEENFELPDPKALVDEAFSEVDD